VDQIDIAEIFTPERVGLIILAFFIFFVGTFLVARNASRREGISLFRLLVWYDVTNNPYTTHERILRAVLVVSMIGILVYAFR
jgi:hypothetical protein